MVIQRALWNNVDVGILVGSLFVLGLLLELVQGRVNVVIEIGISDSNVACVIFFCDLIVVVGSLVIAALRIDGMSVFGFCCSEH